MRVVAVLIVLTACARIAPPPGGPVRLTPPALVSVYPDSDIVLPGFRGNVEFRFDEVISEGGSPNFGYGNGGLEQLVMISPDTAVPIVQWRRDRITVRPRHGWQPNTVYRIELLPGVRDLQPRANELKVGRIVTFTTGQVAPTRTLSGRAIDWAGRRGAGAALIEAFHLPDSLRYRAITDSTGRFRLGPLPDGPYLVVATVDQNRDHRRQPGEAWDTTRIPATRDSVGEIWTFLRDTLPPRIQEIARQDSNTIALTFTRPIDPALRIPAESIFVRRLPDSLNIGASDALPKVIADSVHRVVVRRSAARDSAARRDSIRADSVAKAAPPRRIVRSNQRPVPKEDPPLDKRPVLGSVLVVHTVGPVLPNVNYVIEVHGVRTAAGVPGPPVIRRLDAPPPPSAADSARMRADSARARADSIKAESIVAHAAKPDSTPPSRKKPIVVKPDSALPAKPDSVVVKRPR